MKILIKVTKEILLRAEMCGTKSFAIKSVSESCAIALAIQELFPLSRTNSNAILLYKTVERFQNDNSNVIIPLPLEAKIFIVNFDLLTNEPWKRIDMEPISFEIEVPNEVIDQIGISEVYKILSKSKTLEHVN